MNKIKTSKHYRGIFSVPIFTYLLVAIAVMSELSSQLHTRAPEISPTLIFVSVLLLIITIVIVIGLARVVFKGTAAIITSRIAARGTDLIFVAITYVSIVWAFAIIYELLPIICGKDVFRFKESKSPVNFIDNLYVSCITITTVGYGDVVPIASITKILTMIEPLFGLWLTVTVLGFLIGAVLGRQQQEKEARWFNEVKRGYFKSLIANLQAIRSMNSLDAEAWTELEKNLLRDVAYIVRSQYRTLPSAIVTANWMRLIEVKDAQPEQIRLAEQFLVTAGIEPQPRMWGVLVLQEWSDKPVGMPSKGELVLPVYDPSDAQQMLLQLPGAPRAVSNEEGFDIVSDVATIDLSYQDPAVREWFTNYFQAHTNELKSFASVTIDYSEQALGVINIQSSKRDLCGTTPEEQHLIVDMIHPFAEYLAMLQINRAKLELREKNEKS
jgi:hypothetical protein